MIQKPYPSDRVNNFSDAIFAIGITLLVLEIKIPTAQEISDFGVGGILVKRIPQFIGFLVSFLVTALYWRSHLQLMQMVKSIDNKLLWLNLWLLLFVVLLPFSTGLYSYYINLNAALVFYCLNLAAIGLMGYWMTTYTIKKEDLSASMTASEISWMKTRAVISVVVFLFCIPLAYASPLAGRFGFFLIFIIQLMGDRRQKKRRAIELQELQSSSQ